MKLHQIPNLWQSFREIGRGTSENEWRKKENITCKTLDGQGRARREAARRRKSEWKVNLGIRNSSRSKSPISPEVIDVHTLNFKPNVKFSRVIFLGGHPSQLGCALRSLVNL